MNTVRVTLRESLSEDPHATIGEFEPDQLEAILKAVKKYGTPNGRTDICYQFGWDGSLEVVWDDED